MEKTKVKLIDHPSSIGRGIGFYTKLLMESLSLTPGIELNDQEPSLIHYTFFDLFYHTLPTRSDCTTVVTIHDVTPLVLPKLYPKGFKGRISLFRQKLALKGVTSIITDSKNSKEDIVKYLGMPKEKINVVPLAADPIYNDAPSAEFTEKVKRKYNLPEKFVLYVGGVNPNKNLIALIEATLSLDLPLVLVGSEFTREVPQNMSLKAKLGLQKNHPELKEAIKIKHLIDQSSLVRVLGFVASKELSAIYRLASVYCQPSLYEGFGLPLLEAMACKCLIISSNTSSLPEIYPENTITFDPKSLPAIKLALSEAISLTSSQKKSLTNRAYLHSKGFTWKKTAQATAYVYEQAIKNS